MSKLFAHLTVVAAIVLVGCATTQSQFVNDRQGMALQTVMNRAKIDMDCPEARATVLKKEFDETAVVETVDMEIQRAKYTVGVVGCQKNYKYIVICLEGEDFCSTPGPNESLIFKKNQ